MRAMSQGADGGSADTGIDAALVRQAVDRVLARIDATAASIGGDFPLAADPATGVWTTAPDGRWAGGFWVGMLWLAHHATGRPRYRALAEEWVTRLERRLPVDNVLNGLVFYYGAALGAILDGSARAAAVARAGARALVKTFDPRTGIIPLGRDSGSITADAFTETNIDGLAGMSLLLWAGTAAGERELAGIGARHVRRHLDLCLRADGSFFQAACVDPRSGAVRRQFTPRGFADDSTWARAQSWGLLGLALGAGRTGDAVLLDAARRAADWWLASVPGDGIAFWDFDDPAIPETERDTSATAMAAAALLKLADAESRAGGRERYRRAAGATVQALVTQCLTPTSATDTRLPGILTEGCWQRRQALAVRHELIWGDYFLLEALLTLDGRLAVLV